MGVSGGGGGGGYGSPDGTFITVRQGITPKGIQTELVVDSQSLAVLESIDATLKELLDLLRIVYG